MGWFALVCPACLGGTSLGYLLAHFRSEQLPDEFDIPCAIVEGGWTEAAWTHKAGALGQGTPGAF